MGFGLWDIAQIGIPLAANIVAPGVGGVVASGVMGAGEAAFKGKRLTDILKSGALGAGSAYLGGQAAGALGGAIKEGGKLAGQKGVQAAAQKGFGLGLEEEMARQGTQLGAGAASAAPRTLGVKSAERFMEQAGNVADKTASQVRFLEHMQNLGQEGLSVADEMKKRNQEAAALRTQANAAFMSRIPSGTQYGLSPWVPGRY